MVKHMTHSLAVLLTACFGLSAAAPAVAQQPAQQPAQNRFWLVNDGARVVEAVFVSAARMPDWGNDILGAAVLPPARRAWVVPNFPDCVLDLRVTFQGGGEERRMAVNACALSQIVVGREPPAAGTPPGSVPPAR
jgi:hypothetical protein